MVMKPIEDTSTILQVIIWNFVMLKTRDGY